MADVRTLGEIEQVIREVALNQFPRAKIESVTVNEGTDSDGDPIYNVTVVFDSVKELDTHRAAGFVRHIRPRLMESNQFRFPLVRFISKSDARKLAAA